jgi:predicted Zn-dependent protease
MYFNIITLNKMMKKLLLTLFLSTGICLANELPDLGDYSETVIGAHEESIIGSQILQQVYQSDSVIRDVEIEDYLNKVTSKIVDASDYSGSGITFFIVNDPSINAFAMLGGVIGVHTGLILSASTESELASVLSHEVAHITQRHIARMVGKLQKDSFKSYLGLGLALLLARSNPELARGALAASQALGVQTVLDFTRSNEKEADRIGIKILDKAGFDVRGSIDFFRTLQKGNRFSIGAAPSFLRTHPITSERISDIEARLAEYPYKQRIDDPSFHFVKGKLRVFLRDKRTIKKELEINVKNKSYTNELGERYALAYAYILNKNFKQAQNQLELIQRKNIENPMVEQLNIEILLKKGDMNGAYKAITKSLEKYPNNRVFVYGLANYFIERKLATKAIKFLRSYMLVFRNDAKLYEFLAKAYSLKGLKLLQFESLAESFYYKYNLQEAISQMDMAVRASDGDFYQKSRVEARLKQLQREKEVYEISKENL